MVLKHFVQQLKIPLPCVVLMVWDNGIYDEGAIALAEALQFNSSLKVLDISANEIYQRGGGALCQTFRKKFTLESLNLEYNFIGQECIIALADILKKNSTLFELKLNNTWVRTIQCNFHFMENIAMREICQMLETKRHFAYIELSGR